VNAKLLTKENINAAYTAFLLAVVVGFFARLFTGKWTPAERRRLYVIGILFVAAAVFWSVFEQAGSTLTLFAERSTDNRALGREFPSAWWQSANALFVIALAPLFTWLWLRLGPRNPGYPAKFAWGLLLAAAGFLWLAPGAAIFGRDWDGYVQQNSAQIVAAGERFGIKLSPDAITLPKVGEIVDEAKRRGEANPLPAWPRVGINWLLITYLLHTMGEMCLSPVGLSAMTKLAPQRVVGQMLGVWFLASSVGNFLSGMVATYYERFSTTTILAVVAVATLAVAALMFALAGPVARMLDGRVAK
jgi:POT family proton-dependent oligopeptide transporter